MTYFGFNGGYASTALPVHYHPGVSETFYVTKGSIDLYANRPNQQIGRTVFQNDFYVLTQGQSHTLTVLDPDTEAFNGYVPAGVEAYIRLLGEPYNSKASPYNPTGTYFNVSNLVYGPKYHAVTVPDGTVNMVFDNFTTSDGAGSWHLEEQQLPTDVTSYYCSSHNCPKYDNKNAGVFVTKLATGTQTQGNITCGTFEFPPTSQGIGTFKAPQAFTVLEGMLTIQTTLNGKAVTSNLIPGDFIFIPANHEFSWGGAAAGNSVYSFAAGTDTVVKSFIADKWQTTLGVPTID